jgi:hypothetical protein
VKDAANPQTFCDVDKERRIFDVQYLPGWRLSYVQRQAEDVRIRLAYMDKAGRNKRIHQPVQLEFSNPIRIHLTRFVADYGDPEPCRILS